jgi:predicted XRE-type DNA-binding protein
MLKKRKKVEKSSPKKIEYEVSSGNVFQDFGFPNSEEADVKSDLALIIASIIKQKNLTQEQAAELMGIDQPKVSKLMRGLLSEFTIERLMKYLLSLGFDIEIKPKASRALVPSIHVRPGTLKRLNAW